MANPFEVSVVNPFQALMIGQQSYNSGIENNKKQALEDARNEAGKLYAAGDTKGALARLLTGGDLQGAGTYSGLDQNAWTRQHTEARDKTSDQHWSADYGLRKAANERAGEDKYGVKEVTDPTTGATSFVKFNTRTGEVAPTGPQAQPSAPANPFAYFGAKPQTEAQSKDSGYANRLFRSEQVLRDPASIDAATSLIQKGKDAIPIAGNYLTSPEYQKFDQAKRDFVNAVLRRESGAAISQSEFDNAYKQYFPQPGDSKERILEKQRNRQDTIAAIAGGGGPNFKPQFTFGPNGEMIPTGTGKQGAAPSAPPPPKPGQLIDGYRYKGGNPADPNSWVKAQ